MRILTKLLKTIYLSKNLTTIGEWAFAHCSSLTSITLPNSLTTIGEWAFAHCSSLTSITLPNSLTTIEEGAFYNCRPLTVTIKQTNPTKIKVHSSAFDDVYEIRVPQSSLATYKTANIWKGWNEYNKIVGY